MSPARLIFFCLLCASGVFAQRPNPIPIWASKYETVRQSENVFIVGKSGKMGLVSATGVPITELIYDSIYNFHEGIAIVGRGKREVNQFGKVMADFKYGYLNKSGRLIVPMKYADISSFSEGWGLIGHGNPYHNFHHSYVNKDGEVVLDLDNVNPSMPFEGNMAYVNVWDGGFWLPPYDDGRNNGDHKQLYDINGETIYGNYIDRQGRRLIPWKYDTIAPYYPGYLRPVRKNGKWGFLDSTAAVAIPLQYDDVDADSAFFWRTRRRVGMAGRFGFMDDRNGQLIIPLRYEASKPSRSGFVWVRQGGRWGCLNQAGKTIIPFRYDDAVPFEANLAIVQVNGRWGLVDTTGRIVAKRQYESILPFQENRAVFKQNDRLGFLDLTGREIIPADYTKVSQFMNGQVSALRWGLFITLDSFGHWVDVRLQPGTLKTTLWVFVGLILPGLFYTRRERKRKRSFPM